jgi:formylglycine-generating enzyme
MDESFCAIAHNGTEFYFDGSYFVSNPDCPIIGITWFGGVVYCNWKSEFDGFNSCYDLSDWSCNFASNGYRLPTEAEWEYAARGGENYTDDYRYSGCHEISVLPNYAWFDSWPGCTYPVGIKLSNQLDIHDMSGNVFELCWDWLSGVYYNNSPNINPTGPDSGIYRCTRGGSFDSQSTSCRVSYRGPCLPDDTYNNVGFRMARNAD